MVNFLGLYFFDLEFELLLVFFWLFKEFEFLYVVVKKMIVNININKYLKFFIW